MFNSKRNIAFKSNLSKIRGTFKFIRLPNHLAYCLMKRNMHKQNRTYLLSETDSSIRLDKYRIGMNICEWIPCIEYKMHLAGIELSSINLLHFLSKDAYRAAMDAGLKTEDKYDRVKRKLIKIFQPRIILPKISTLLARKFDPSDDIEVFAKEIYETTKLLLSHPNKNELIEHITLDAYLNTVKPPLSDYLKSKNPRTIKEAMKLTYKFQELIEKKEIDEDIEKLERDLELLCPGIGQYLPNANGRNNG